MDDICLFCNLLMVTKFKESPDERWCMKRRIKIENVIHYCNKIDVNIKYSEWFEYDSQSNEWRKKNDKPLVV